MLISELILLLIERAGVSKSESERFCNHFFSVIKESLLRESYVKIKGFGTFKLVKVDGRESVDVNTGERIEISEHSRIVFIPDKMMASRINKPFENFDTLILDNKNGINDAKRNLLREETQPIDVHTISEKEIHSVFIGNDKDNVYSESDNQPSIDSTASTSGNDHENDIDYFAEIKTESGNKWKMFLMIVVSLFLIVISYFFGYYKLLDVGKINCIKTIEHFFLIDMDSHKGNGGKNIKPTVVRSDTYISSSQKKNDENKSQKYEQLPDGDFLIEGVLEEHELKPGESLIRLSQQIYGDKKLVKYVIFFNHISDPDVVAVGTKIRFPQLTERK